MKTTLEKPIQYSADIDMKYQRVANAVNDLADAIFSGEEKSDMNGLWTSSQWPVLVFQRCAEKYRKIRQDDVP